MKQNANGKDVCGLNLRTQGQKFCVFSNNIKALSQLEAIQI